VPDADFRITATLSAAEIMALMSVRTSLLLAGVALAAQLDDLQAQRRAAQQSPPGLQVTTSQEALVYLARVERSASLERLLYFVLGITDRQRAQIEQIEDDARHELFRIAEPLRSVRREVRRGWPSEPEFLERPVNAIIAFQDGMYRQARSILTPEQQPQFDRNLFWSELRAHPDHRRDIGLWMDYIKPFMGPSSTSEPTI